MFHQKFWIKHLEFPKWIDSTGLQVYGCIWWSTSTYMTWERCHDMRPTAVSESAASHDQVPRWIASSLTKSQKSKIALFAPRQIKNCHKSLDISGQRLICTYLGCHKFVGDSDDGHDSFITHVLKGFTYLPSGVKGKSRFFLWKLCGWRVSWPLRPFWFSWGKQEGYKFGPESKPNPGNQHLDP